MNAWQILKAWWQTRTLASKLSLGVVGSAATIAVIFSFAKGNPQLAGIYIIGGFASIVMMALVQKAISGRGLLGLIISIVVTLVFSGTLILSFTKYFFDWPASPHPHPRTGISLSALQTLLRDADGGPNSERLARAMGRDIEQLATDRLPITGDSDSTRRLALRKIDLIFLQGSTSLVKIQTFDLSDNAKQFRGLSTRRFDEGHNFIADSWAFVFQRGSLIPCERSSQGNFSFWQVPTAVLGKNCSDCKIVLVALYSDIHFFEQRADNISIAVDDLAGMVDEITVGVVGQFKSFQFDNCFEFGRDTPLTFLEVPSSRLTLQASQLEQFRNSFNVFRSLFKSQYVDTLRNEEEHKKAQEALEVWSSCCQMDAAGNAISIRDVTMDIELLVSGQFQKSG